MAIEGVPNEMLAVQVIEVGLGMSTIVQICAQKLIKNLTTVQQALQNPQDPYPTITARLRCPC